jgi:glycine/D-amino acid oxidase-like deaminating enzyme
VHLPDGRAGDPEVYPRPDGTVYVCGAGYRPPNPQALPATAAEVNYPKEAVKKLKEMIKFISPSHFDDSEVEVVAEQGCFRPNSSKTGSPIIGRIGKGIYIASGHNVWGILQGESVFQPELVSLWRLNPDHTDRTRDRESHE